MTFVQATHFTKRWNALGLTDGDLHALEIAIMVDPKAHPIVSGTGGLRRLRFAGQQSGKGKRSSFRVGYVCFERVGVVFLLVIDPKNEQNSMSSKEKTACKELISEIERAVARGSFR